MQSRHLLVVAFAGAFSCSTACGNSSSEPGPSTNGAGDAGDGSVDAAPDDATVEDAFADAADDSKDVGSDVDAGTVSSSRSAFGIFAGFTREFSDYEQAAGLTHPAYLDWAGEQYVELGARWTRSNLQLIWDLVEPSLDGAYDWTNPMGTHECFAAAAAADVNYLAVFHEGGVIDPQLRSPFDHPEEYQRFVRDVVERYDGDGVDDAPGSIRITHWQVGNETMVFSDLADPSSTYVDWFALTAEAVRQADPDASMVVVASTDGSTIDALHAEVIPALAQAGVTFEVVDIHHWGGAGDVAIEAASEYRTLLDSVGAHDVELWSTEHGTHVGTPTPADVQCNPPCSESEVCVQPGPVTAFCVPRCTSDGMCPAAVPFCDVASGHCVQPPQTLVDQARSLVQRYVVNRDAGFRLIMWNNLVAWHEFGGHFGGVYDRMGLVSGGFLEFETEADRGMPRPAWFAYRMLASKTDEPWAERLGPVDRPGAYVSAYRNRQSGVVGWVAWSDEATVSIERDVQEPAVRVTSFVTDEGGAPTRDEMIEPTSGTVTIELDGDPVWIEPLP